MEMRYLTTIEGKTGREHIRNGIIRRQLRIALIRGKIFEGHWRWFGHAERRIMKSIYEAKKGIKEEGNGKWGTRDTGESREERYQMGPV